METVSFPLRGNFPYLAKMESRSGDATIPISPIKSVPAPQTIATKRMSLAPEIPADADEDTRLAMLKDKFQFFAQSQDANAE